MGLFDKLFGSSTSAKKSDPIADLADYAAQSFVSAFWGRRVSIEELDSMSETLIEVAQRCWNKGDYESFKKVLSAAKATSYMYHGNKYPHDLVEDIIRSMMHP